jgi:hypothetical protein
VLSVGNFSMAFKMASYPIHAKFFDAAFTERSLMCFLFSIAFATNTPPSSPI